MREALNQLFPQAAPAWLDALAEQAPQWGIDTPNEMASFCAQLYQESMGLTRFEENLYYTSLQRLVDVWPSRFGIPDTRGILHQGLVSAYLYVRNPERLANYIYDDANRSEKHKLGNTQPGDGWRYRGRGPIQITGKNNYLACGTALGVDLLIAPDLLKEPVPGIRSACWYWRSRGLDKHDDDTDVRAETRLVNGGEHGLAQRQQFMDAALKVLV